MDQETDIGKHPVIGILLAGGKARRMGGGDKCLLDLDGRTLLSHAIERLSLQVDMVVLNANGPPERFAAYNLPVVADPISGFAGPLAGILAGMDWAIEHMPSARWIVTAASDTPFFPSDLIVRLLARAGGVYPRIVLAQSNDRLHPVFGLWPTALRDDLRATLKAGTRKVLDWTDRHDTVTAAFEATEPRLKPVDPFFNTNRPEDLDEARRLLEHMTT